MDEYEERNTTIWARHPKLFKDNTYMFEASKELVMCMPFDFINGSRDKIWTCIDHKWLVKLMKHLKKAQSNNIKQIRFIRQIGRLDIYHNSRSREYDIQDDCHIHGIFLENNTTHYVNFGQINDIIGDEEWLQGEGNCLCNITSSWIISLSWGAKKKESTNSVSFCVCVGDHVSVENPGNHWIHLGHIISIDKNTKTAVEKWEETLKKDTLHLGDCKKYNKLDVIPRKRKSTDFFCEIPQTTRGKPPPDQMKNKFFWWKLVKVMHWRCHPKLTEHVAFLDRSYEQFWELATSDLLTLMKSLNESFVPKAVLKPSLGSNLIQKCLWILCKKFNFQTTKKTEHQAFSVFEVLIESAFRN
jgi:hypothetical protein